MLELYINKRKQCTCKCTRMVHSDVHLYFSHTSSARARGENDDSRETANGGGAAGAKRTKVVKRKNDNGLNRLIEWRRLPLDIGRSEAVEIDDGQGDYWPGSGGEQMATGVDCEVDQQVSWDRQV